MFGLFAPLRPVVARLLERFFEVRALPGRAALQEWVEVVVLGAVFVLAAITAPTTDTGAPNAPGQEWFVQNTGGGICLFRRVSGIDCPGCGLTRGFVQLEHGDLVAAVHLNPLTPVVFFLLASRLLHSAIACVLRLEVRNRIPHWIAWKLWGTLFMAFCVNGIYRIIIRLM